ncbi:DUF6220 domain-containing protein [Halorarum halobium]|uniref:DUF6220 domain-containing protein n=1 Tax=Halorarum halobium TaxID=3075121 RepID=UPI0028AA97EB|nr:DUF6220 domain-containing protein [Halobaculum sp. XH14]
MDRESARTGRTGDDRTGDHRTRETTTARSRPVAWARLGYVLVAAVFTCCVLAQTYLAGIAVFVDPANWRLHAGFVHLFEPLLLVLLLLGLVGRLPRFPKLAPAGLFALVSAQYATASMSDSLVAAVHPVNAVLIVLVSALATGRAWSVASGSCDT